MTAESTFHRDSRLAKLKTKKEKGYNDYFMKERTDIKEQNDMVTAFMCLDLRQEVV